MGSVYPAVVLAGHCRLHEVRLRLRWAFDLLVRVYTLCTRKCGLPLSPVLCSHRLELAGLSFPCGWIADKSSPASDGLSLTIYCYYEPLMNLVSFSLSL